MNIRAPWLAVVTLLLGSGIAFGQVKDVVDLLPADTLACIELRQPSKLAREVAALLKTSSLEDIPKRLAKKRAENEGDRRFQSYRQQEKLGMLSVFLSPEMLDEANRIRGGFIALTGFAKDGTPEVVGVLHSGTSNLPGMYMRGFQIFGQPNLVGEIEGVSLYREVHEIFRGGAPPQSERHETGPVLGRLPNLLLFGSSVDSLKGVIRRAKGKSAAASLTNLRAFKNAAALRDRPGLFAYVDAAVLEAKLGELAARSENLKTQLWMAAFKSLLGDQAIRTLTFSLTLQNGALEAQARCILNDKSVSPLLGLLPDGAAPRELLHFAPNDALLALTAGLGDNDKRWKTFVNLLDTLYTLQGRSGDNRPSRSIQEMEKKLNFQIHKDVLAEVIGAGIVVPKQWQRATLLLRAANEKAAAKLEKNGLPLLFSLGGGQVLTPKEAEIQGQRIQSITKWGGLQVGFFPAVHYGRRGAVLVIGFDPEGVANALAVGGKKEGLLGALKVADAVKETDAKSEAVGVLSPARPALDLLAFLSRPRRAVRAAVAPGQAPPAPVEKPSEAALESSKSGQALLKVAEPLVLTLNRQPDSLVLEMRPLSLRRMTPRLLEVWIEALLQSPGEDRFGGAIDKIIPNK